MEQNSEIQDDDLESGGKIKEWIQDNFRIIISVLIVILIAGGIYSYSKRTEQEMAKEEEVKESSEELSINEKEKEASEAVSIVGKDEQIQTEEQKEEQKTEEKKEGEGIKKEENKQEEIKKEDVVVKVPEDNKTASTSEETDEAFIETAQRGDSLTVLARKALRSYLEKNNDSNLTKEHKIYIEDYLRKSIQHKNVLLVGERVSFSKKLIQEGIEKSKTLNEKQLENLKKYSARVNNL